MLLFAHVLGTLIALAPSPTPSPSTPPEIAHVYTADRTDETLRNANRTTYVVSHDDIVRNGYRTIAEAIADVPGVQLSPFGALGSSVSFGIRGSGSAQVLTLIDGLPAPGAYSNTVELGNLPTTGVDRIEIVEGGGSTLYGTGAIGGIINIITQRSSDTSATLRAGSFGDKELYLNTSHIQLSRVMATNDFGLPDGGTRPDSDYEASALHANEAWRMGSFNAVIRALLSSDKVGTPGSDDFLSPTSREADVNEAANLALTRSTQQAQTTIQAGATRQQIEYSCDSSTDPNCGLLYASLDTESRIDLNARNAVTSARQQLLYGVDLSRGYVRSDSGGEVPKGTPPVANDTLSQTAAYAQDRYDTAWGNVYGGLRGERDGSLGGEFSPSLGLLVRLSNSAAIKANAATAFRAPNASELYFPGFGNPNLVPERAKVADLSLVDSHVAGGASLTWFMNRTNDLIAYDFTTNVLDQIDHAAIDGITFDVKTPPYHGMVTSFNLTNLYRAENVDTGSRLANDPVFTANMNLEYTRPQPGVFDSWGVSFLMSGERGTVDTTLPVFDQPVEYATVNAYARFRAGAALLTLRGYNLGNERYAAVPGYPMPGRSVLLEVSTK